MRVRWLFAVLAAAATLSACGSDDSQAEPQTRDDSSEVDGASLYVATCATCHAADGSGGLGRVIADGALNDLYTVEEMASLVADGTGEMPGFADRFTAPEIEAIVSFVRSDLETAAPVETSAPVIQEERTTRGAPPELEEYSSDWPLPNRDHANSRAVFDSPIDSTTVADLVEVWRYDLEASGFVGPLTTTPLILGGRIYFEDNTGVVHAIDADTGDGGWTAGPVGSLVGPTGVAAGWDKVFGTKTGASGPGKEIAAYDIETGEELGSTSITANGGQVNIQASVHDGLVLGATSGFPAGVRGTITALDQRTGDIVWQFDTIESPDLWGNPSINSGGGSWYPPAVDTEANILYFGTGNPYPFPGATGFPAGTSRPGDNRWTSSTVALDGETGELVWGHQPFPHDLFDRDHVHAALSETGDGEGQILVTVGKGAVMFGLDPATGEELWSTTIGSHQNDDLEEFEGSLTVLPGGAGGVATPIAVADGVAYASVLNAPITYEADQASDGFGTAFASIPTNVVAVDVDDGTLLWDHDLSFDGVGAMTVVNDLVFTSTMSGSIIALDRATGEEVWSMQAAGGINGWPAVAGDMIIYPVGLGPAPHMLALKLP